MSKLNIDPVQQAKVSITVDDTPNGVAVVVKGDIDMQDPSTILDPLFAKVHQGCMAQGIKLVEADLRQLAFLNSSGIKALAKWIMSLAVAPADKRYAIKILHNKQVTWQATSLPTLTFLVPGAVTLE